MHNHGRHLNPTLYIDAPMRTIAVSWLVEVACEYGLHQETLFLSTMLLDNFLCVAKVCHLPPPPFPPLSPLLAQSGHAKVALADERFFLGSWHE